MWKGSNGGKIGQEIIKCSSLGSVTNNYFEWERWCQCRQRNQG